MTAPQPSPLTRAEWDSLVEARVRGLMAEPPTSAHEDPAAQAAARDALEDAQVLEGTARAFADAVDRDGRGLFYGDAVVMEGSSGPLIVPAADFRNCGTYWQVAAAGHGGTLDAVTHGQDLLHYLLTGEERPEPSGAHAAP